MHKLRVEVTMTDKQNFKIPPPPPKEENKDQKK